MGKGVEVESADRGREIRPEVSEHGLKEDAIGFRDALIIGIASTAPAYSLAAVIGLVVVTVGVQAPAKQNPNEQFVKSALGLHLPRLHHFWPFCFFRHFPGSHRAHSPHGFLHLPDLAARLPDGESPMRARIAVARALLPMRAMPRRDVVKGRRRAMASNALLFMGNLPGHPRRRRGGVATNRRR